MVFLKRMHDGSVAAIVSACLAHLSRTTLSHQRHFLQAADLPCGRIFARPTPTSGANGRVRMFSTPPCHTRPRQALACILSEPVDLQRPAVELVNRGKTPGYPHPESHRDHNQVRPPPLRSLLRTLNRGAVTHAMVAAGGMGLSTGNKLVGMGAPSGCWVV